MGSQRRNAWVLYEALKLSPPQRSGRARSGL
jgi:hypothetical protein